MSRFDDEELHDLAAAYALDAVDDLERQAFERHLRTCERCQEEVASYGDAVLGLAESTPPVTPPPALRQSVLDQLPEQAPAATPGGSSRPERRVSPRLLLAAAAVVVTALGGGLAVAQPWSEPTVVASLDDAAAVQIASDAQHFEADSGPTRVVVTVSDQHGRAVVRSEALSAAPKGHAYQGWFIDDDGAPRSAGLVVPGRTQVLDGRPGTAFALTVEPAGGSAAPTTEPMMTIRLG